MTDSVPAAATRRREKTTKETKDQIFSKTRKGKDVPIQQCGDHAAEAEEIRGEKQAAVLRGGETIEKEGVPVGL